MADQGFDEHLYLAQKNIGQFQTELAQATREYNAALNVGDEFQAQQSQAQMSDLEGKIMMYENQIQRHVASKQPQQQQAPYVSPEARAQRRPEELDVHDLSKITGLDPKTYMNYAAYYRQLKANKVID
jgi:hypothetical protein